MPKIGMQEGVSIVDGGWGSPRSVVSFEKDELTDEEVRYVRLVSNTNFFQLIRTAVYMQEGLSFRNATIKYLKIQEELEKNRPIQDNRNPMFEMDYRYA